MGQQSLRVLVNSYTVLDRYRKRQHHRVLNEFHDPLHGYFGRTTKRFDWIFIVIGPPSIQVFHINGLQIQATVPRHS